MITVLKFKTEEEARRAIAKSLDRNGLATRKMITEMAQDLIQKHVDALLEEHGCAVKKTRYAWIKSGWRPIEHYRIISKGKRKGWFEVTLFDGKKHQVSSLNSQ
jgi:hypothetical protein